MKVYSDNVIASAMCGGDFDDADEKAALEKLVQLEKSGRIKFVISAQVAREMDRTRDPAKKAELKERVATLEKVERDHVVLGFQNQDLGRYGYISCPLVTDVIDESMFSELAEAELDRDDAIHFVNAVHDKCDVFLSTDSDFINPNRPSRLQAIAKRIHPIRILKPSELLEEITR